MEIITFFELERGAYLFTNSQLCINFVFHDLKSSSKRVFLSLLYPVTFDANW